MAEEGLLVLASRCRKAEEVLEVKEVIEKVFKRTKIPANMFSLNDPCLALKRELSVISELSLNPDCHLAMTKQTVRTMALTLHSFKFNEPVLLIGGTGLGKTSACQIITEQVLKGRMFSVNCHMNTDAADFLGSLRPVRGDKAQNKDKLFEWQDGPLIRAMKHQSGVFLVDEISLADDSVIERLNPVLEDGIRRLTLAERDGIEVESGDGFKICATMNPGGDFGKKELSPALRNRFTEIWCPADYDLDDLQILIEHLLPDQDSRIIGFILELLGSLVKDLSYRDIRTFCDFMKKKSVADPICNLVHATCLVITDGIHDLGFKAEISSFFKDKLNHSSCDCVNWITGQGRNYSDFGFGNLEETNSTESGFGFTGETVKGNAFKVLRGMKIDKPVLLEGPPGVGKSSMISALASKSGNRLTRIQLSEQTDISDLFGSDLPAENQSLGKFVWTDGPFLR